MRRRLPHPSRRGASGPSAGGAPQQPLDPALDAVLAREPVTPPTWDTASALLHARLTDADRADLERHRGGDFLELWEAADEAQRRRIDLIWAAHLALPGPLASTGLVPQMPPEDVHAMAHGPLAAGGDHGLADVVLGALQTAGLHLAPGSAVLDFGASSGRVTRVLAAARPDVTWLGCDPNAEAVAWAREHLPMAEFFPSPLRPPLDLADGSLDAAFAISIWSHFAEGPALEWLAEMHRVLRPGGRLLLTTHGFPSVAETVASGRLDRWVAREAVGAMLRGEHHFVDVWGEEGDWGVVDPSWGDAWFTPEWLAARATPRWAVRLHVPGGLDGNQDLVVLERCADPVAPPAPAVAPVRPARISAWIRFHRHPEQIARLVKFVAPHVDEVVLVADEQVDAAGLETVADALPDRLLRVPRVMPPESANAYLARQMRGDWVLQLDGDEVPSPALLRDLRRLTADRENVAFRLVRLWVWPDAEHVLAQRPWWPDSQVRLARTHEGAVHHSGRMHVGPRVLGPWHDVEHTLLHLDLVETDRAARERKVAVYAQQAELPRLEGLPFNEAYYLPEAREQRPAVIPLGDEDRAAVAYVLHGEGAEPPAPRRLRRRRPATDVPVVPVEDLDAARLAEDPPGPAPLARTEGVVWDPARARVRLEVVDLDLRTFATGERGVWVRLHHEGELDLSDAPGPGVRARSRWEGSDQAPFLTGLSARVRPGDVRYLGIRLLAPPETGPAILLLDVVDGDDRPLCDPVRLALEILPAW